MSFGHSTPNPMFRTKPKTFLFLLSYFEAEKNEKCILVFDDAETMDAYIEHSQRHSESYSSPQVLVPLLENERARYVRSKVKQKRVVRKNNGQFVLNAQWRRI